MNYNRDYFTKGMIFDFLNKRLSDIVRMCPDEIIKFDYLDVLYQVCYREKLDDLLDEANFSCVWDFFQKSKESFKVSENFNIILGVFLRRIISHRSLKIMQFCSSLLLVAMCVVKKYIISPASLEMVPISAWKHWSRRKTLTWSLRRRLQISFSMLSCKKLIRSCTIFLFSFKFIIFNVQN